MMTGAIMQSYFFPYLGYFQLIEQVDEFILHEYVNFRRQSWMTRNRLFDKRLDQEFVVKVPVQGSSSLRLICDIKICDSKPWRRSFLRFVQHNYGKAKYFDDTYEMIQVCMEFKDSSLHRFNSNCIEKVCQFVGIETKIISEDQDFLVLEDGLEQRARQNELDIKTQRIIEICRSRGWTTYLNTEGGAEIYRKEDFKDKGINIAFWRSELPPYPQFSTKFCPGLSILDLLMHIGPRGVKDMLHAGHLF